MNHWICNGCGKKVAESIKTCPYCKTTGTIQPIITPSKVGSFFNSWQGKLTLSMISLFFLLWMFSAAVPPAKTVKEETKTNVETTQKPPKPSPSEIMDNMQLSTVGWGKDKHGMFMVLTGSVTNNNNVAVKDPEIVCTNLSKSGTDLGNTSKKIYEVIAPKSSFNFTELQLGMIHSETASVACHLRSVIFDER